MVDFPKIFFHVGLGKTGTTYLQYKVFPKLKGIYYIQRTRYKNSKKIIHQEKHERYLVSREFDQQFEKEVSWFATDFKNVRAVIVLRRHDSWIASQYRRFIKNGFNLSFDEFFDLKNNTGYFSKDDLSFYPKIKRLEELYDYKPLVLFHHDLKNNPQVFFKKIAKELGVKINISSIDLRSKHTSYQPKQLSAVYSIAQYIDIQKKQISAFRPLNFVLVLFREIFRYTILFVAQFLPESLFSKHFNIPKEKLNKIHKAYSDDWKKCVTYANNNN